MRLDRQRVHRINRVGKQTLDRQFGIGNPVDERGIGTVLKQTAHQVGQQILMAANRRINPAGTTPFALADHFVVKLFAHTMQTLILPIGVITGQLSDGRQRMCVMRCEGGIEDQRVVEQALGTGQIRHIGRGFACKYRVLAQAALLRHLDFGVPVRPFDEAYHQSALGPVRQISQPVECRQGAFLVSLNGQPQPIPAGQFGIKRQRLDQIEGYFQAIHFLGINRKADVVRLGFQGQCLDRRPQFAAQTLLAGHLKARMQS